MTDAELRAVVFEIDGGWCAWPQCVDAADELAHLTSKGMGGSRYRNEVGNAFAACRNHARISDGLTPVCGGIAARNREYRRVPGAVEGPHGWKTRDVVEALRIYLDTTRGLA